MTETPAALSEQPLRSVHTTSLSEILAHLNLSLVVTTYQAGKVILVRHDATATSGGNVNTHFRNFDRPMGLAQSGNRLTIGGASTVWELRNMPDLARKLEPVGKHDACFLPRRVHITGDIDIHEMGWTSEDALWLVNTRFSCLCTLDVDHSFYPRWRPHFVTAYAPEDRCHLNGLAIADGRPKFVTALGRTDSPGGWRADKARGGILMDVDSNEVLLTGLSMPHSPRWYRGRLWLLESGEGSLVAVNLASGTWETVARMPGFTRGIDFVGPLAFIGLSQVRETATFSGIPLVSRLRERTCGVWVVNIETGKVLGFLRFESGVREIFAVQALTGVRFPEILEWGDPRIANAYVLPDRALSEVQLPTEAELADAPATHHRRGVESFGQQRFDDAVTHFERCLDRDPAFPNARFHLGVALGEAGRLREAGEVLDSVIRAEPERAEAYNSLGFVLGRQGLTGPACEQFRRAIEQRPDYAEAHVNLGLMLLRDGDYPRGFEEYAWRWKGRGPFSSSHPHWNGDADTNQRLLVVVESDASEAILLARYLPRLVQHCGRLLVSAPQAVIPVLAAVAGINELRVAGQVETKDFDVFTHLGEVPRFLGATRQTVPAAIPYLRSGGFSARRQKWEAECLPGVDGIRIGLAGARSHPGLGRSVRDLAGLPVLAGVTCIDLDWDESGTAKASLVHPLPEAVRDLGDMAALIDRLDLVIGVDSPAVHLAGALGRPVWVIVGNSAHWSWGAAGESSAWYPHARVFRGDGQDDWEGISERIGTTFGEWRSERKAGGGG